MSLIKRYKNNPILTKHDIPYHVATVHNAGVTKYNDKYIMIFRSHLDNGRSILGMAESSDGFNFKAFLEKLVFNSSFLFSSFISKASRAFSFAFSSTSVTKYWAK